MEDRLIQLLKAEGINPTRFAERIGVQRSSMSHILSGRNKPSYDFIVKILESFPALNPDWLLRGKGLMYKSDIPYQPGLFDTITTQDQAEKNVRDEDSLLVKSEDPTEYRVSPARDKGAKEIIETKALPGREVEKIVIFYSDQTFSEYKPAK